MGALSDNAGILFRIRAEDDATATINKVKGSAVDLGASFGKLTSAAAIGDLIGQSLAKVGDMAVRTVAAVAQLTVAAAEYGSKILEASQKTGLTTETISALKYAADQSGSSLEQISNSIAKFSTLLGQAATGNEKAQKILALYGVTAKDTDTALAQAITTIAQMTDTTTRSAAAAALFKDRTGEILPVIESFDGNLPALMDKLRDLGLLMSKEDAEAADKFGDTLDTLKAQAEALGRQFATELMPAMTDAMNAISRAMADNKDIAADWGKFVIDTARGVEFVMVSVGNSINNVLAAISLGLINQQSAWSVWASAARVAIAVVTGGLSEIIWALSKIGQYLNQKSLGTADIRMGDDTNTKPGFAIPSLRGGGGGGRGRGGGGGGGGQNTALQEARAALQQRMALLKAENAEVLAQLDQMLKGKAIREQDYIVAVRDLKQQEIQAEIDGYQKILDTQKLKAKERVEIENKIKVLQTEQVTEATKSETKLAELKAKNAEEELKLGEQITEAEKKRLQEISDLKQKEFNKDRLRHLESLRRLKAERESRTLAGIAALSGGSFIRDIQDEYDEWGNKISEGLGVIGSAFQQLKEIGMGAIQDLAAGIGSLVGQWVLMGDTGGATFRKLAAQILASVAMQAATMAVLCLAYAALATTAIGAAILGGTPAQFLQAAALFGAVAVGAAIAGRLVAGDSFKQQTNQATGRVQSTGGSGQSGGAYSSQNPQTINVGATGGGRGFGTLEIKDKSGMFSQLFEMEWQRNGAMRKRLVAEFG